MNFSNLYLSQPECFPECLIPGEIRDITSGIRLSVLMLQELIVEQRIGHEIIINFEKFGFDPNFFHLLLQNFDKSEKKKIQESLIMVLISKIKKVNVRSNHCFKEICFKSTIFDSKSAFYLDTILSLLSIEEIKEIIMNLPEYPW